WMFTGSERAGRRAAAIQSLLATAKLNGIEPAAWLKDTLEKLPTWPNSRIDELLPLGASTRVKVGRLDAYERGVRYQPVSD
ncbi:transposase domain-containing protein, partial [Candidatus Oleimmundimicrobium sp.]|uniref:transposase domain-containing protein n=1 Tax=Candidatus Oleimmundimicrobium sp. TaxID=3060597 RepID=UPI002724C1A3